jgi:uncharacterized protein YdeI (YjbR/CyaY-like superfamily)
MTTSAEVYFEEGCGRCSLGGTPDCKVHKWAAELALLRKIILSTGLTEECKWGGPIYTYKGTNTIMLGCFKDTTVISFFKGVLLSDPYHLLVFPGENSQSSKVIRYTNAADIEAQKEQLKQYIIEAIEVEKAGLKVSFKQKEDLVYPEELEAKFKASPDYEKAFKALTAGRQRSHIIHFTQAKQAKTRQDRVEASAVKVFAGKGHLDR